MRARRTAGVLSVGVAAVTGTVVVLTQAQDSPQSSPERPTVTAAITRQTLIDRESHAGTLAHGDTTTISSRGPGTVTALPAEDSTVRRGHAVFRLDNRPVSLLYGSLPAYRTLSTGVTGADVRQFERNLRALGYRGFTVDRTYSWATAAAVKDWQDDLGRARTGVVTPSQIEYSAGAVRVDSLSVQVGTVVVPGTVIEKVTARSSLVTLELDTTSGRLAHSDAAVLVTLPNGKVVPGRIIKVATVVSPGEDGEADTTRIRVTIGFTSPVTNRGTAAVTVALTAGQRRDVLTVPVAALLALAEGGYGVQVVDAGSTRIVAVQTGLFADAEVEIAGTGLRPGLKVVMPA